MVKIQADCICSVLPYLRKVGNGEVEFGGGKNIQLNSVPLFPSVDGYSYVDSRARTLTISLIPTFFLADPPRTHPPPGPDFYRALP